MRAATLASLLTSVMASTGVSRAETGPTLVLGISDGYLHTLDTVDIIDIPGYLNVIDMKSKLDTVQTISTLALVTYYSIIQILYRYNTYYTMILHII